MADDASGRQAESLELSVGSIEDRLVSLRPRVVRHITAMTRDPVLAEDLTQDTYARALSRINQLRDPQAGLAWLYRIATTTTLDWLRRTRPDIVPLDSPAFIASQADDSARRPESMIDAALERREMSDCVQNYLDGLSDDYRVVVLLHDVHGLTNPQIAAVLGCSLPTVKIRVHRARERLREALGEACTFETDERGVLVCNPH